MFSFTFDNVLAPGRYSPVVNLAHRGSGLDVMDRFERGFSFVVTGSLAIGRDRRPAVDVGESSGAGDSRGPRPGEPETACQRERRRRADPLRGPRPADQGPRGADRRLAAVLAPDLQHRADRVEAAVLRLGARLRVAARAAAAAVQRAVRVLHRDRARRSGTGRGPEPNHFYGAQLLGSIVLFTFFAEATGGAVRSVVDNEALVRKIQFPRMVIPLSIVLLRDVQPGAEPGRRARVRADRGRRGRC